VLTGGGGRIERGVVAGALLGGGRRFLPVCPAGVGVVWYGGRDGWASALWGRWRGCVLLPHSVLYYAFLQLLPPTPLPSPLILLLNVPILLPFTHLPHPHYFSLACCPYLPSPFHSPPPISASPPLPFLLPYSPPLCSRPLFPLHLPPPVLSPPPPTSSLSRPLLPLIFSTSPPYLFPSTNLRPLHISPTTFLLSILSLGPLFSHISSPPSSYLQPPLPFSLTPLLPVPTSLTLYPLLSFHLPLIFPPPIFHFSILATPLLLPFPLSYCLPFSLPPPLFPFSFHLPPFSPSFRLLPLHYSTILTTFSSPTSPFFLPARLSVYPFLSLLSPLLPPPLPPSPNPFFQFISPSCQPPYSLRIFKILPPICLTPPYSSFSTLLTSPLFSLPFLPHPPLPSPPHLFSLSPPSLLLPYPFPQLSPCLTSLHPTLFTFCLLTPPCVTLYSLPPPCLSVKFFQADSLSITSPYI